jgi:hypothetical protein
MGDAALGRKEVHAMFPLASLTSIPVDLAFGWGSVIPLSMVVALLVSGAGVLHAAMIARRQSRSTRLRRQEVARLPAKAVAESRHSTIAA